MNATTWTDYTTVNQLPVGEYLWRVSHRRCGVYVIFRDKVQMVGHGYGPDVSSPGIGHWDGYRINYPKGAQYRAIEDGDPKLSIEGVKLLPCPFCGEAPTWSSGGRYVTARPNHSEHFTIGHCIAEVCRSSPCDAASVWNRRAEARESAVP